MRRTSERPLPARRIEPPARALTFGLGLTALSLGIAFIGINALTAEMIALGFAIYVGVMLSPELHDEFSVPYLDRLSDAFGGVYIHSCGDWTHLFPSLEKVRGLRGLEFGASEAPYDKVLARFGGRTVLACRVGLHRDIRFDGMADFVRRVVAAAPTPRGLFIHVDITNGLVGRDWPETDLDEISRILDAGNPATPVGDEPVPAMGETIQHGIYKGFIAPAVLYVAAAVAIFRNMSQERKAEAEHREDRP